MIEIVLVAALTAGIAGVISSSLGIYLQSRAERKMSDELKKRLDDISKMGKKGKEENRILTEKDYDELVKIMKSSISKLELKDQSKVAEPLEQKSKQGQIDYVNRLLHISGVTENVKIEKG